MDEKLLKKFQEIIIPLNDVWQIDDIVVNHIIEEVEVYVSYIPTFYKYKKEKYSLYDKRPARRWRHLDLWQYTTVIIASVPRIKTPLGVRSIDVPWAEENERLTRMLEKKL